MVFDLGIMAPIAGWIGLFAALLIFLYIYKQSSGSGKLETIAQEIRAGTMTFLRTENRKFFLLVIIVSLAIGGTINFYSAGAFLYGAVVAFLACFLGLRAALLGNVRTVAAAKQSDRPRVFAIALLSGSVSGLGSISIIVLSLGALYYYFATIAEWNSLLLGFVLGVSSFTVFARMGGGIFNKVADLSNDYVAKVEIGVPEGDQRNPGVIADHVGDNIGGVAGFCSESILTYSGALVASMVIASTITPEMVTSTYEGVSLELLTSLPLLLAVIGLGASFVTILMTFAVKKLAVKTSLRVLNCSSILLFLCSAFYLMNLSGYSLALFFSVGLGAIAGVAIQVASEFYTSCLPVKKLADASKTSAATNIIAGLSLGFESAALPLLIMSVSIFGSYQFSGVFGVSLACIGLMSTSAMNLTIDLFGPIADNASGICEMAQIGKEPRKIIEELDFTGKQISARGKSSSICHSILATLILYLAFYEIQVFRNPQFVIKNNDAFFLVSVFIGIAIILFSAAHSLKAVGKAASIMIQEIRRQFREIPGLLNGTGRPDTSKCVEISTQAALKGVLVPVLLAVVVPSLLSILLGSNAVSGVVFGAMIACISVALPIVNAGSIWENAKKIIESNQMQGERVGGIAHQNAVIGDTVGDPLKDTTGPSMSVLIKIIAVVSLLVSMR